MQKLGRQRKKGDRQVYEAQKFLVLEKVFTAVTDFAIETFDMIESHAVVYRSPSKPDRVDYLITVQKLSAKLSRPLRKQFKRLLRGEAIGAGSRRMCVAKLAPEYVKSELFPRMRWFAGPGWVEAQKKKQQSLSLAMSAGQVKKISEVAEAFFIPLGSTRHFDEAGAPPIKAEPGGAPKEPAVEPMDPVIATNDGAFANQELSS